MSVNLGTEQNSKIAYVSVYGNYVDIMIRAKNYEAFIAAAKIAELLYEVTENHTDEETGEVTAVGTGVWEIAPGVNIDELGSIVIEPEILDVNGDIITPAVIDFRYHANIRLTSPATDRVDDLGNIKWHKWALAWTLNGQPDTPNAAENARTLYEVSLIDPDTISSPSRVWL